MLKRRFGAACFVLGAVLLAAALLLFLHNEQEDRQAGEAASAALTAVQQAIADQETQEPTQAQESDETASTEPETTAPTELTVVNIDGNDYVGYLSIPYFELELPILAQASMEGLQIAPCLQYGSPLTDDAVIAGHNFKQHFRALHDIQPGEYLTFTDMNGYTIEYGVVEVQIIDPTDVYSVINSEYDLILYTCTTGGATRVIVCCNRLEKLQGIEEIIESVG